MSKIKYLFYFFTFITLQLIMKKITQLFYNITNWNQDSIAQKASKQTKNSKKLQKFQTKMQAQQQTNQFYVKQKSPTTKIVKLNNSYEITQENEFFHFIDILVLDINHKNGNNKYHIKQRFGLNYFSSIQFKLGKNKMEEQKCTICLCEFQDKSTQQIIKELSAQSDEDIYILPCSHIYHIHCLMNLIGDNNWAKCPVCSTIFGKMTGNQPQGKMDVTINKQMTLSGCKQGAIVINYYMQGGTRNGVHFNGTSRTAYLPDNQEGKVVLELLKQAFNRRLIFTVGRSVTTGLDNQTVWNGIHHKTSPSGGTSAFGYPDPTYLKRVTQQLAAKGVTLQSLKK